MLRPSLRREVRVYVRDAHTEHLRAVVTHFKLDPAVMTIKGAVFVFVTASLLYFTIRRLVQAVQLTSLEGDETRKQAEEALRRLNRELRAIG